MSSAPASASDGSDRMGRLYAMVLICHALVISFLWLFGRVFSS
jgi:hypothetical protein